MRHLLAVVVVASQCGCLAFSILERNVAALAATPAAVTPRPCEGGTRLEATWIGHATVLLRMDDRVVLTDPALLDTVAAGFSKRLVAPGIPVAELPSVDAAVVSHLHLDHLSLGSLGAIETRLGALLLPPDGLTYLPDYLFPADEVAPWTTVERAGVRLTALPVRHPGARYALDGPWMQRSAVSWLIEYDGLRVYFAGDTALDEAMFREIGERVGPIDLALLPIGPVEPADFARGTHLDGAQAVTAFQALGARHFMPIHFDTFAHGVDPPGLAVERLQEAVRRSGIEEASVHVLAPGVCLGVPLATVPTPSPLG